MVSRNFFALAIASIAGLGVEASKLNPSTTLSTTSSPTATSLDYSATCGNLFPDPSFEEHSTYFGLNVGIASNGDGLGSAHDGTNFLVAQMVGPYKRDMSFSRFVHGLEPGTDYKVSFWYALGDKQEWKTGTCWLDTEAGDTVVKFDIDRSLPTGQYKQVVATITPAAESIMLYFGLWCRGDFGTIDMTFDSFAVYEESCPN